MAFIDGNIFVERVAATTVTQALVEGELSPPAGKPDIASMLFTDGLVNMGSIEVLEGKLMMEGSVSFRVAYSCVQGKIYGFEAVSAFRHSVEIEGLELGMRCDVKATMASVEYSLLDNRRMQMRSIVDLECKAVQKQEICVTEGIDDIPDIQVLPVTIEVPRVTEESAMGFVIREDVRIPQGTPAPQEIFWTNAYAKIKNVIPDGSKIVLEGEVKLLTVYCADGDTGLAQVGSVIPFEQILPVDSIIDDKNLRGFVNVKEAYVNTVPEAEGLLSVELIMSARVESRIFQRMELITDAYSPSLVLELETRTIDEVRPVVRGSSKLAVHETISVPDGMPPAARTIMINAHPMVANTSASLGKAALEGVMDARIVYLCKEGTLRSFQADIPFHGELDINGLEDGMELEVEMNLDQASASGSGDELETRFVLDVMVTGFVEGKYRYICSIAQTGETPQSPGGIIIYFAERSDTLWSIAKRFNTTVSNLLEYNKLEGDEPMEGRKLMLFKPYSR